MRRNLLPVLLIALVGLGLVAVFYRLEVGPQSLMRSIYGVDFARFFYPALGAVEAYAVPGFYNPPWMLGLVWLADRFGEYRLAVWVTVNLCAFVFACVKLKMPLWCIVPFFFFSGAMMAVFVGNVEGLVALGLVLPAPVGIVLLMLKPQIGAAVTLHYVLSAWVYRGWRAAALLLVPVLFLFSVSLLTHGVWFLRALTVVDAGWNSIDYFPMGLPIGVALIVAGVARRNVGFALMAIPFTTPYMIFHTWAFPFLGVVLVLVKEVAFLREMVLVRQGVEVR